jgi:hypothetical protein
VPPPKATRLGRRLALRSRATQPLPRKGNLADAFTGLPGLQLFNTRVLHSNNLRWMGMHASPML